MQLPVLIEPCPSRAGYLARLGSPFDLTAEGTTPEEARDRLTELVRDRMRQGLRVEAFAIPLIPASPGWLPDDELTREWLDHVRQYREECDRADKAQLAVPEEEKMAS